MRRSRAPALVLVFACAALLLGCDAPADASVLLELDAFSNNRLPDLREPQATLDVTDADGAHVEVEVKTGDDESTRVKSPLPVPCDGAGRCALALRLRPATVTFTLHVSSLDRCGARAELVRMSSKPVELAPYQSEAVTLGSARFDFDDDEDGVVNVLEHATCGRVDVAESAAPPQACAPSDDPCCAGVSPLEGHQTAFAGGAHTNAAGDDVTLAPFALDATEVTWRQLARCVAAGACLENRPEHPSRVVLESADPSGPVVGLTPTDAQALCAHFGKRLPTDDEWDFAAAHRASGRARYPWDGDEPAIGDPPPVGCERDFDGIAANFSIPGEACPGVPLPVGSYPSSYATHGAGEPVADLGGNVAEWTLVVGDAPAIAEIPAGHVAAALRGGGALSPLPLLENDLAIVARMPQSGDADAWRADVQRLSAGAGFRCASDVEDGSVAPPFDPEPVCGGDD
jgi:formylglycine-generating enzyme required for sulfatase activity